MVFFFVVVRLCESFLRIDHYLTMVTTAKVHVTKITVKCSKNDFKKFAFLKITEFGLILRLPKVVQLMNIVL